MIGERVFVIPGLERTIDRAKSRYLRDTALRAIDRIEPCLPAGIRHDQVRRTVMADQGAVDRPAVLQIHGLDERESLCIDPDLCLRADRIPKALRVPAADLCLRICEHLLRDRPGRDAFTLPIEGIKPIHGGTIRIGRHLDHGEPLVRRRHDTIAAIRHIGQLERCHPIGIGIEREQAAAALDDQMSRDMGEDLVGAGVRTGSGGVCRAADLFALVGICHIDGQRRTGRGPLLRTSRGRQHERGTDSDGELF